MKDQLSQLVQDVIDGKESAFKAGKILREHKQFIDKCIAQISDSDYFSKSEHGDGKDNDKPGTF